MVYTSIAARLASVNRWPKIMATYTIIYALSFNCLVFSQPNYGNVAAESAFEQLSSLAGDWEAKVEKGPTLRVNYRLYSSGSALVQTFNTTGSNQTLTIFHLDGISLLATHYCAQGNQPKLRFVGSHKKGAFGFSFLDITNLDNPQDSHLSKMQIDIVDPDHITVSETYTSSGKDDTSIRKFVRVN